MTRMRAPVVGALISLAGCESALGGWEARYRSSQVFA